MQEDTTLDTFPRLLRNALCDLGFRFAPAGTPDTGDLRAVKGHCEVQIRFQPETVSLRIPVVHMGVDRPVTTLLSNYLTERNKAPKKPGTFEIEEGTIWYTALAGTGDPVKTAAAALAMQEIVEKTGPRILNILR